MNTPRLENWKLVGAPWVTVYTAPETIYQVLIGDVYDDDRAQFEDGHTIRTGTVRSLDLKARTARTYRTTYTLGKPESNFLEWLKENGYASYEELSE